MARELDININVQDADAKQTLGGVDQALDSTTGKANALATGVGSLESQLSAAKTTVNNYEAAFKQLGVSLDQPNKLLDTARQRVSALEQQMGGAATTMKEKLSPALKEGASSMDQMDRIATRLVERMAILYALKGTFDFVKGVFDGAGALENMATNLDLSTTKLQEWQYASIQTGVPLSSMTAAVDTLGKRLASGNDSTVAALEQLGLATNAFFAMEPGPRFDAAAAAIAAMGDKTARTGVEMALFGTDKIDPLIVRLNELEKAAHDANAVIGPEGVKQLAEADKSLKTTELVVKSLAAQWLLAAQNAFAYYVAARNGVNIDRTNSEANTPEQVALAVASGMANPLAQPDKMTDGAKRRQGNKLVGGLDPSDPKGLAAITATEKSLTDAIKEQIGVEKEQEALEKVMYAERLRVNKQITQEINAQVAAMAKAIDGLVMENLAAKGRNNGAMGLDMNGDPKRGDDPFSTYNDAMRDIDTKSAGAPGVNVSDMRQEAERKFQESNLAAAQAADALQQADAGAAAAATTLTRAHAGAVQAADMLSTSFGQFGGVIAGMMPTVNVKTGQNVQGTDPRILALMGSGLTQGEALSLTGSGLNTNLAMIAAGHATHFADGGYAASPTHAIVGDSPGGEYMIPAQQMKSLTGGGHTFNITIGSINSRAQADRYANQTAEKVYAKIRGERKVQLGKAS